MTYDRKTHQELFELWKHEYKRWMENPSPENHRRKELAWQQLDDYDFEYKEAIREECRKEAGWV